MVSKGSARTIIFVIFWVASLVCGYSIVVRYQFTAGAKAASPPRFAELKEVSLAHDAPTLLLFAHPRCPCTRASLDELRQIVARLPNLKVYVICVRPKQFESGWEKTDIFQDAQSIEGVTAVSDPEGDIATAFGARTSGQVILFDSRGKRVFAGGITPSRGHSGDNTGEELIVQLAEGRPCRLSESPVFGCPLLDQETN